MISSTGNRRGFTFIELIVVLLIISILAGISMPRLSRAISAGEFKDFITKFYLFLDYGRSYAVLRNSPCALEQYDGFVAMCDGSGNCARLNLPENVELVKGDEENVAFFPDGTSQPFEVTVLSRDGDRSVLFSRGFDGRIMVRDGG